MAPKIFAPETYQYNKGQLTEDQIEANPLEQFQKWFQEARAANPDPSFVPEATTFSTASLPSGRVSSRVVLLKELDDEGFVVYSNWDTSKKAKDYETNKYASLSFFWPYLQRQVRVEGSMERLDKETSSRYFKVRPRGSQIGAWASPQSTVIKDRAELEKLVSANEAKFKDVEEIECPDFWGGVRIVPLEIEYWQGRDSRLHDRLTFRRDSANDQWKFTLEFLNPLVKGLALDTVEFFLQFGGLSGTIGVGVRTSTPWRATTNLVQVGEDWESLAVTQWHEDHTVVDKNRKSVGDGDFVTTTGTSADENTSWLTDQGAAGPQTTSRVPESLPLGWKVAESGGNTEQESVVLLQGLNGSNWNIWLLWSVHLIQDLLG